MLFSARFNVVFRPLFAVFLPLFLTVGSPTAHAETSPSWRTAQRIDSSNYATTPQVATDEAGNAMAVWTQYDGPGSRSGVWVNRYSVGPGWGTPELINDNPGQTEKPRIGMDARGNAMVVWMQYHETKPFKVNIWANRYVAGKGWDKGAPIESGKSNAYFPEVVVDSQGNAIALWSQNDAATDTNHVYASRYSAGTGWSTPVPIQSNNARLSEPAQIAIDAKGNAIALWIQIDQQYKNSLCTNRYTRSQGWGGAQCIVDGLFLYSSHIAMDERGNAMAVWLHVDNTTFQQTVYASYYAQGRRWSPASLLQADRAVQASAPTVAMDKKGNAIAVWKERSINQLTFKHAIYSNHYKADSGWGGAQRIGDGSEYANPRVAMDEKGAALAVWEQDNLALCPPEVTFNCTAQDIYAYRYHSERGWDKGVLIEKNTRTSSAPEVIVNEAGIGTAVWVAAQSVGTSIIWANRFE